MLTIALTLWLLGCFGESISKHQHYALLWDKILYTGISLYPVVYFHFLFSILDIKRNKKLLAIFGVISLFFLTLNYTPLRFYFVQDVAKSFSFRFIAVPNFFWFLLVAYIIVISVYGFILIFKVFCKATGHRRNQLKYLLIAFAILPSGGGMYFLLPLSIKTPPIDGSLVVTFSAIIAYAIFKYRLMDIRLFISRAVAFFLSYPILIGLPFYLGYRIYPSLYPVMGKHWWLVPGGLLAVIATLAPLVYGQLRKKMEDKVLADQKRYQKLLLQAARGMSTEHDTNKLSKLIVYITKRAVKIKFAAIFLDDSNEANFKLRAMRDSGTNPYKNVTFLYEHPFIEYIKQHKVPFFFDEMPQQLRNSLTALEGVSLVIPSMMDDNLLGFLFLGEKDNRQPYTEDDIDVFRILSHQAALAIENCHFLEEFKQAQERIFTAEKLASIGGMADGVAHQIKNRLNQFSVASGELKYELKDFATSHTQLILDNPDLKKTVEYIVEIADSLIKNVKKTDGIIKGILNFARVEEKETFFGKFALGEIVELSRELLQVKHEIAEVPLEVQFDLKTEIYGVKAQITEAIYNILDNCFEAMMEKKNALSIEDKESYTPLMKINLTDKTTYNLIEISDNGSGISKKNEHKIFAPFFTTKSSYKSGTGIGMYVVKRMVEENHHGKVWFRSQENMGTTLYIELPKK